MKYFDLIRQEYSSKMSKLNNPDKVKLVSKAYSRFKRGVEICWEDIKNFTTKWGQISLVSDLLVELPQIKSALNKIDKLLLDIENSSEMELQVIYGEYGHGKSQIAQILEENYSNSNLYPNIIHLYHKILNFNDFLEKFSNLIKTKFEGNSALSKVEKSLEKLEKVVKSEKILLSDVIDIIIKVICEIARQGRTLLIIFDEIDTILTNPEEFKPWGDLFVRLNDSEGLKLILILLLPQSSGSKIRKIDVRLQRWDVWFGIDAVILSGKYQNQIPQAIANILAMKSIASKIKFNDFCLEFITEALNFQQESISNDSIRSVNLWAIELAEMIQILMDFDWEKKNGDFNQEDTSQQGNILENHLRYFLLDAQIPDFKILNEDTEDFDIYQSVFSNENLKHEKNESDGQFIINQLENKIPVDKINVAVEIKYTSTGDHSPNQITKIKTLAMGYPIIFISLGSSEENYKLLNERLETWYKESSSIYPILILRLPKNLLSPLLILTKKDDSQYLTYINVLTTWANRFCPFLPQIRNFFINLPEKLMERKIALRMRSIGGGGETTGPVMDDQESEISLMREGIKLLCSFIDEGIKKYKLIHVLENEIKKEIKNKHPKIEEKFIKFLPQLLKELIGQNMMEQFKYSGTKGLFENNFPSIN